MYPADRLYTREHEWIILEGDGCALVGITQYAQEQLGDVVFVDLPEPGSKLTQHEKLGEVESVKAVSDLFSPASGEVFEVNQELLTHPEAINEDPNNKGWMVRLASVDPAEVQGLMSAEQYEEYLSSLG